MNSQTATVKYGTTSGSYTLDTAPTATDEGTTTVYWQVTAPNHAAQTGSTTIAITAKNVSGLTATGGDQSTIKGVGEFTAPVITGVKSETLEGTLTYSYGSETNKSHADVVNMLKTKAANDEITLNYSFTPYSSNYTGTITGSINFTIVDIECKVGDAAASAENALTVKASPVYGDNWSDIVKIKDGVTITAKVGTNADTNQNNFTLKQTGKPNAGNSQTYELVYNGSIGGADYTNVTVVSGTVNVAKKTLTANDLTFSDATITKAYNGNDTATATVTILDSAKVNDSDTLPTVSGTYKYNSADVKTANMVTFTSTETSNDNYALPTGLTKTHSGSITAKSITPTIEVTGTTPIPAAQSRLSPP